MKTRRVVVSIVAAGAVALAVMGCARTAQTRGDGPRYSDRGYAAPLQSDGVWARGVVDPASDRTGRDVAVIGALETLSGTLAESSGEWYLETETGRYLLHLGNAAFVERVGLKPEVGARVEVRGFVDGEEVSVVTVALGGRTYALRTEDGSPLWAGGGRGAAAGRGGQSRGAGQGRTLGASV